MVARSHESLLRLLRRIASLSTERFKISAAVVLPGSRIVSLGVNHSRSDSFQDCLQLHGKSNHFHAEMSAVKNALRHLQPDQLSTATLYVCRMKRSAPGPNRPLMQAMARPCPGCIEALHRTFRVGQVVYSTEGAGYGILRNLDVAPIPEASLVASSDPPLLDRGSSSVYEDQTYYAAQQGGRSWGTPPFSPLLQVQGVAPPLLELLRRTPKVRLVHHRATCPEEA